MADILHGRPKKQDRPIICSSYFVQNFHKAKANYFIGESVRANQKRANKIFVKSEKCKRAQLAQDCWRNVATE